MKLTTFDHDRDKAGLRYVYPVVSRRACGVSIGINLNTDNACNWRCVYCQVPGLVRGAAPTVELARLEEELRWVWVFAGFSSIATQEVDACVQCSGPGVEVDALLMFELTGCGVDGDVDAYDGCGLRCAILCKDAATLNHDFFGQVDIDGDAVPGGCILGLFAMALDRFDTRRDILWEESQRVAG